MPGPEKSEEDVDKDPHVAAAREDTGEDGSYVGRASGDDDFLIGPDPDVDGLFWAAALGGHGVSCSAGVGRLAAAHLLDEEPSDETARALDPRRFRVAQPS